MPRQINIVKLSVPSPLPSQVHGFQQPLTLTGDTRPCPGVGIISQEAGVKRSGMTMLSISIMSSVVTMIRLNVKFLIFGFYFKCLHGSKKSILNRLFVQFLVYCPFFVSFRSSPSFPYSSKPIILLGWQSVPCGIFQSIDR